MNKSLNRLVLIQFKTFFREPSILFWAIFFPIIMAWILGVAFSKKGESLRTIYVVGAAEIPQKIAGEKIFGKETGNVFRIKIRTVNRD